MCRSFRQWEWQVRTMRYQEIDPGRRDEWMT